jgi:curved DNA-binding protein
MLYTARRHDAEKAGVGVYQIEKLLGVPEKHLEFHIWYLREKGWIQREESGGFAITASGVDVIMEKDIPLKRDRLLQSAGASNPPADNPNRPGNVSWNSQ